MITLDALRLDVAQQAWRDGQTPFLQSLLLNHRARSSARRDWFSEDSKPVAQEPGTNLTPDHLDGWEARHSPGSFTYAAHAAFFAGFWPTPIAPGHHPRPFALRFAGSHSINRETCVLEGDNIVTGLKQRGYHTICIGGVGYFNKLNPLGSVFPSLFDESEWRPEFAVSELHSTREQVRQAVTSIVAAPTDQPLFLFINVSATHSPTHFYLKGARTDSTESQVAALAYVDRHLPPLFESLRQRGRGGQAYLMSDHGTLFGDDGYTGHRVGHPAVWTVPYAEFTWDSQP